MEQGATSPAGDDDPAAHKAEIVRRSYAAWQDRDREAMLGLYHEDCEWTMGPMAAAFGTDAYRGHSGLRQWWDVATELPGYPHIDELRLDDAGSILVQYRIRAELERFDAEFDLPVAGQVISFKGGLIFRVETTALPPPGWADATPVPG